MTPEPTGFFSTLSAWIQGFGTFLYENVGLSLLMLWCFTLFAMTEFAKPFLRRLLGSKEDAELSVKAFPQVMGAITGYWFFPAIIQTTGWGHQNSVSGPIGIGAGFVFGIVTIGLYELSRNGKVIRFTKLLVKKIAKKIPFIQLTDEEIEYIAVTEAGMPNDGLNELQDVIDLLKKFGALKVTTGDDGESIVMTLVPYPEEPKSD